jgi:Icc-related predicted phosphoesterase
LAAPERSDSMSFLRRRTVAQDDSVLVYHASDVHGSDQCWRKFLGAGKFYGADVLIMGGDLTGKAIVPVRTLDDGAWMASLLGEDRRARTDTELDELLAAIRYNGMYPWMASDREIDDMAADADAQRVLFEQVMLDELRRWTDLADARMADSPTDVLVIAGNDDPWTVDDVLKSSQAITFCDASIVEVHGHEVLSSSYSNRTPWDSPRELDEDALYNHLRQLTDQLERPHQAIFNLHVPPYDSGLDTAPEIDTATMSYVYEAGKPRQVPVGSTAVRQIIEEAQPLLGVHGHIHESRGVARIGNTVAINSGSEYNSGRIHGALVKVTPDTVVSHQLVIG